MRATFVVLAIAFLASVFASESAGSAIKGKQLVNSKKQFRDTHVAEIPAEDESKFSEIVTAVDALAQEFAEDQEVSRNVRDIGNMEDVDPVAKVKLSLTV